MVQGNRLVSISLNIDLDRLFNTLDDFILAIPEIARAYGVKEFIDQLGMNKPKYYRRLSAKSWTIEELKAIASLLKPPA